MENPKKPEDGSTSGFEPNSSPLAVAPLGRAPSASAGSRFGKIRASFGSVRVVVFVVLGLIVIAGGAYAFHIGSNQQTNKISTQPSDNFGVQDIELKGLTDPNSLGLSTFQSLSINGQLRVNNSLIITPGGQPKEGTAGQIYYDKDGNFLSYYDGEQFLNLVNSEDVANLQDQLDELFGNLSVSGEVFLPEDIATLSSDNVFNGFNVFEGGLEGSDLSITGAALLQGDLGVSGTTDLSDLNVSGTTALGPTTASSLVLSSPLDVASGGTGAGSFTNNGVLIGQGSSPLSTVSAGGAGLCLVSTGGAPAFQACPGSGPAVDSLNGLTGALSIANATGAGTTITINDATTAAKGIASFSATNFSVSGGAVNTIQNIAVTSTPTFAGLTLNGNLSVGSNGIVTGGATISSTELDVLDGGISEGEVTGVITDVTAGNGLTGGAASGNATVNIASANGAIVINADNIAFTLQPSGDGLSATTSSGSGLEVMTGGLSLLQGCSDSQILKWNETADTWGCADDAGGSGVGDDVSVNGLAATHANFIDTVAGGSSAGVAWTLNTTPSPDNISITISNASGTQAGVVTTGVQSFAGDKTYNNAVTVTGLFTANGGVTIETGDTFTFNGDAFIDLSGTGLVVVGGILQASLGTSIDSSEIDDLAITGADIANDTIALGTKTAGNYVVSNTAGTGIAITGSAGEGWSPTISLDYSADLATNSLGVNQSSFAATGILFEGATADAFETLFTLVDPTADNTITIPNASGTICLTTGNCAGAGSGVTTTGGTSNRLAKFTTGQNIENSTITDDGANVTTSVSMIIQGGNVTAGTNAQLGSFILNDGNGQMTTLRAGDSTGNLTFILPTNVGSQFQCLKYDTAGQLIWDNCDGGSGGGSGVTALNGLSGTVTIQGNSQIGVSASSPNINLSINADSIGDAQLEFNTGQHLTVNSTPTFAGLIVTGSTTANRPASPSEGRVYYDTDTDKLLVFSNGKWQADRTDSIFVAASNSSQADKDAADYVADGNTVAAADGDQVQINAALTAASGRKVVLLAGTYVADTTILIPNNTTLAGVGSGTLIELADLDATDNLIENSDTTTGTRVVIRDLRLDGRNDVNSAGTQSGIYLDNVGSVATNRSGAKVIGVEANNFRTYGIAPVNSANTTVANNTAGGNSSTGIFVSGGSGNVLTGNVTNNNSTYGIWIFSSANNTVTGNTANSNGNTGFVGQGTSSAVITGNTASNNANTGIYLPGSSNSVITGNSIAGNGVTGVFMYAGANTNTISGNKFFNNGGSTTNNSIYINDSDANTITGNSFTDSSATTTNYAINIVNSTSDTNYLADNSLGGGSVNDLGTGTIYGGQTNSSGNFMIQPTGTIELLRNTNITGNLGIGSNSIVTNGATISSTELDVLDGGISESEVTGVVTDVTAGTGLGGGGASGNVTLNITSANGGIVVNADDIALTLQPSANAMSSTTSSGSGLEILSGGLSLLQGCADGEVLKWNETTDTWGCAVDAGGSGLGDDLSINGSGATNANFIDTIATGSAAGVAWVLNTTPSPDEVSVTISNASATVAGVVTTGAQTFAGDKTFNSAVTIASNLTIGSNNIITSGATISSTELDVLDGGISESEVTGVVTDVTAGTGLGGGGASGNVTLNITSANGGIVVNADDIALTLQPSANAMSSTTSSGSGLEILSGGLSLLQGCGDAQILKWNETTDTWGCGDDAGGSGLGDDISVNGAAATHANFINTTASGTTAGVTWSLNTTPSPDDISLTVSNASATVAGVVTTGTQTFAGDKTFNNALTIQGNTTLGSDAADTLSVNAVTTFNENITVAGGKTLTLTGGVTGSRPGSPTPGMLYYDSSTNQLLQWNGTKWVSDRSTATKIIAPSNASQAAKDSADVVLTGTADQTLINTALTTAAGGKVYIMEGTVNLTAAISIPNSTTLAGAGQGTLITVPNAQNGSYNMITNTDTTTGTGVTIQDLRIDGNKANQTSGIMKGIYLDGMGAGSGGSARLGARLTNLVVKNMYGATGYGVYLNSSSNNTVTGNTAQGNDVGIGLIGSSSNNTVTGNTAHDNSAAGISLNSSSNNNTVTGNTAQGNGTYGIVLSTSSNNNTVTGNTIQGTTAYGIYITNSSNNNTVTGNTVHGSGTNGIRLTTSSNNTVTGNTVADSGGATNNNGIYLTAADSNTITGNTITDTDGHSSTNYAINIFNSTSDTNYLADNTLGGGSTNDAGTGTIYGGQTNSSGNFMIQPTGTIELLKNTNVTGTLNVTNNLQTSGSLTVGNTIDLFIVSNLGVVTAGRWQGEVVAGAYGGTGQSTTTVGDLLVGAGSNTWNKLAIGSNGACLTSNGTTAGWGTCTATNLQGTYAASSPATIDLTNNKNFTINATEQTVDSSILFNLQCVTCSASGGRFAIQDAGVDIFTVNPNGDIIIGTAANNMTLTASNGYKPVLSGTARNSKKIRLHAEYPSVVLAADGLNNTGTMTSGYDSAARMNYYNWTTTQGSNQDYDIVIQVPLPSDFSAWDGANPLSVTAYTSNTTNGTIAIEARDSADAQICNFASVTPGSTGTWATNNTACTLSTGTYTAGDYITLRIKLQAPTSGNTRVGNITLNYLSRF